MNQFNRSNPFVIKMRAIYDLIINDLLTIIKRLIIINIAIFIISAIIIVIFKSFILIPLYLVYIITLIIIVKYIITISDLKKVDYMLNSDEYKIINVNNEDILEVICQYYEIYGKLNSIYYVQIVSVIMLVVSYIITLY